MTALGSGELKEEEKREKAQGRFTEIQISTNLSRPLSISEGKLGKKVETWELSSKTAFWVWGGLNEAAVENGVTGHPPLKPPLHRKQNYVCCGETAGRDAAELSPEAKWKHLDNCETLEASCSGSGLEEREASEA
ncbi:uncharacterized protein LOC128929719 [Callithrix jacchus]